MAAAAATARAVAVAATRSALPGRRRAQLAVAVSRRGAGRRDLAVVADGSVRVQEVVEQDVDYEAPAPAGPVTPRVSVSTTLPGDFSSATIDLETARRRIETQHVLRTPSLNRGTGFTKEERDRYGLRGLLPACVESIEQQAVRVMNQLRAFDLPIERYLYIMRLHNINEALFYHVLSKYLTDLLPIVYTPTVGEACLNFSGNWRTANGLFITREDRGHIRELLDNWPHASVDVIVVTDGGRVLGLGDLGCNAMPISVGKLCLYVAGGGFRPNRTLPVMLDLGTNNQQLLDDPLYVGARHERLRGEEYDSIVAEFVDAVKEKWPHALIQFEDFSTEKAIELLHRHRHDARLFNDDIQGTGAVIAAGVINGCRCQGLRMADSRIVFYGAGSAAVGVAETIAQLICEEEEGLSIEEARERFWMVDSKGLITTGRGSRLEPHKVPFARRDIPELNGLSLLETIRHVKPTALMGLSGVPQAFTEDVIAEMCNSVERPIVFPLSNPTSKAEVSAENAVTWSKGKVIFAAGSPFPPVTYDGKTFVPGQGNNMLIFPGVGFGAVVSGAKHVSDRMFLAAAKALATYVPDAKIKEGELFPSVANVREISARVAAAVVDMALQEGHASIKRPSGSLEAYVQQYMYQPVYDVNEDEMLYELVKRW